MSALLGRIPSAVGYQPTLATDMGTMQERITTTRKGSITSVQVSGVYSLTSEIKKINTWQVSDQSSNILLVRLSMCQLMT